MARNLLMTLVSSATMGGFVVAQALLVPGADRPLRSGVWATEPGAAANSRDPEEPPQRRADEALVLFREQIRPLLVAKCIECHHAEKQEGGLDLSSRRKALAGGESGPAIVPGQPEQSLAYQLVMAFEMPPDLKNLLSSVETAVFKRWIELGAPYDREPLTLGDAQSSGSRQKPDEAMMCPCMTMMMHARGATTFSNALPLEKSLTMDRARERAGHYLHSLGNPHLKIGWVNEAAITYEVQVLTKEGSLVNWIIVDKKTGRLKMLY